VKYRHATAALVVGKLCSSKRQQNALTSAIKEYGALRRTVYAARYLADPTYRRRIARQLNKGLTVNSPSSTPTDTGRCARRPGPPGRTESVVEAGVGGGPGDAVGRG